MMINNKITYFLTGPYIFFGLIFIAGVIMGILHSDWIMTGVCATISWYLLGTFSGVEINTETRNFKIYNRHFGVFKTGHWRSLSEFVGLTLVPMKKTYQVYSRSNRSNVSEKQEYRIYLVNHARKPAIEIKRCHSEEKGQNSLDELAIWLHLPVYSVKH